MDQQFLEREKELFKLNAKLNARTKKIQVIASTKVHSKPVQIHTANNYFNYYEEQSAISQKEVVQEDGLELLCKKINISNQPVKKPHEIVYPLFNRQTAKMTRETSLDIHIHLPADSTISDGKSDSKETEFESVGIKTETIESISFKNESLVTRYSDDSSAIPPAHSIPNLPMPFDINDVIPRSMEKKNISNDGLLKFLKSKVALLQTELEAGKSLNDILEKENAKHLKKIKKFTTQADKTANRIETLESSLKTLQEKQATALQEIKDKDVSMKELNRELFVVRDELKETNYNNQVIEKRLLKTQEDYEMIRSKFETFKDIEIIMRESSKDERNAYEEKIKKLRKGRMDLLKAYKQQIILIDNLRRQNVCLEKAKALEIAEKEFLKVLDWSFAEK